MDNGMAVDLLRDTIWTTLWMSAPILAAALVTGLTISVFQAATQINEQTLTFVPKILVTLAVFGLFFPLFAAKLVEFTQRMILGAGSLSP